MKAVALLLPGVLASANAFAAPIGDTSANTQTNIFDPNAAPVIRLKVTAAKRPKIAQQKGSETVVSAAAIENKPGVTSFSQVIASSVPGTASSSSGEVHIRGSHGQYSYYLDGAPLPANVSGSFSDLINPKDIETLRVYTGGFPAQYGGQLAAIFDVTAKGGKVGRPGGFMQQLAEGYGTYESIAQAGGSSKDLSYFVSGIHSSTDSQISPVTQTPLHDAGNESVAFGKFDYQAGASDRITFDTAVTGAHIDIPNTADREAVGQTDTQEENGGLANLIWQRLHGADTMRLALYSHSSRLQYNPSAADLVPSAGQTDLSSLSSTFEDQKASYLGLRLDQSAAVAKHHQLGYGFDVDTVTVNQNFQVTNFDSSGKEQKFSDIGTIHGGDKSAYLQDDWAPGRFDANYGVRYDVHQADIMTSQVSPRINLTDTAGHRDSFRAYYDRLFQPADIEDVKSLGSAASSSGSGQVIQPFQPERDDFYQFGWSHAIGGSNLGLDTYYRVEKNPIDDDVIGSTQIDVPINFSKGYAKGIELTLDGSISKELSYYANFARSWAQEDGPITGGLDFGTTTPGYIFDDHDQTNSGAFGLEYDNRGVFWDIDGEYGSGFPYYTGANGDILRRTHPHLTLDLGLGTEIGRSTQLAFTVDNAFNHAYIIKQADAFTATEWALGRQYGMKLTESF